MHTIKQDSCNSNTTPKSQVALRLKECQRIKSLYSNHIHSNPKNKENQSNLIQISHKQKPHQTLKDITNSILMNQDENQGYRYLVEQERLEQISPQFIDNRVTQQSRRIIINHIIEVNKSLKYRIQVVFQFISLFDWYLSRNPFDSKDLKVAALSIYYMSLKYEEVYHLSLNKISQSFENGMLQSQALDLEQQLLEQQDFRFFKAHFVDLFRMQDILIRNAINKVLQIEMNSLFREYHQSLLAPAIIMTEIIQINKNGVSNLDQEHCLHILSTITFYQIDQIQQMVSVIEKSSEQKQM